MIRRLFLMAGCLAVLTGISVSQDDAFVKKAPNPGEARVRVNEMRDGKAQVLKGANETRNKSDLLAMAKSLMYPVTEPVFYLPPEPDPKNPTVLRPAPVDTKFESKLEDLDRYVLKVTPTSKFNFDQRDYIQEMGVAFDKVLNELYQPQAPTAVRINTVRMLALVAKSGAPAHAGMITKLIADPNTPPEILTYALQAAGNLLSAYDIGLLSSVNFGNHTLKEAELVKLIDALEKVVNRQTPYTGRMAPVAPKAVNAPASGIIKDEAPKEGAKKETPKDTTKEPAPQGRLESNAAVIDEDQAAVMRFLRRQAVRALAQVRMPIVNDARTNQTVRPLNTLARIAINDGTFTPALGADEYGEAVIGLSNLRSLRNVDLDAVANAMAIGARNFASYRGGGVNITWKTYGARMNAAFAELQRAATAVGTLTPANNKLGPVVTLIQSKIATPLENSSKTTVPTGFALNDVTEWINSRNVKAIVLFTDLKDAEKASFTLKPADPK